MTDDRKQDLIERIQKVRNDGYLSATYLGDEHVGDLLGEILDVFESAQKPTEDEREALRESKYTPSEFEPFTDAEMREIFLDRDLEEWAKLNPQHRNASGEDWDRWLAAHDAEVRAGVVPEEPEVAGYYVIPKADNADQDSLWDGTIHATREAAQASLDEARADWGQDADRYRVVALLPVEGGE